MKGLPQKIDNAHLVQQWLKLGSFARKGSFWIGLAVICLIAASFDYRISFSISEGFHFGPAERKGVSRNPETNDSNSPPAPVSPE